MALKLGTLCECNRCKYTFTPKTPIPFKETVVAGKVRYSFAAKGKLPKRCPRCKNPNWNLPDSMIGSGAGRCIRKDNRGSYRRHKWGSNNPEATCERCGAKKNGGTPTIRA